MIAPNTHLEISSELCGEVVALEDGHAVVALQTTPQMAADSRGLVHGGFVFGAADYAAMLAVNDPNVVLGAAEVKFLAPVRAGALVHATADLNAVKGKKHTVAVEARVADTVVFTGTFVTFVLEKHVLDS